MERIEELANLIREKETAIKSMFTNVNIYPDRFRIEERIDIYNNTVKIDIIEREMRWASSEIVSVRFEKYYWNETNKISYNYGSGGWNSDNKEVDELEVMSLAFLGAKHLINFMKANEDILAENIKELIKLNSESNKIYEEKNSIDTRNKIEKLKSEITEFTKNFELVKDVEDLMAKMSCNAYYGYDKFLSIEPSYTGNGVTATRIPFEYDKDVKLVFKMAGKRISKKDLENVIKKGLFVIDENNKNILGGDYRNYKKFESIEEMKNAVGN